MQTQLTFLLEDSPANHSHLPEKEKARMMNATCGAKCFEQFKKLNRDSSSLKMSLVSRTLMADWYSSRCALIWKLKGTKYSRLLFQLQPKTHRTEETVAGSLELGLLPTPTAVQRDHPERVEKLKASGATDIYSRNNGENRPNSIIDYISFHGMLPTPSASDIEGAPKRRDQISQGTNGNGFNERNGNDEVNTSQRGEYALGHIESGNGNGDATDTTSTRPQARSQSRAKQHWQNDKKRGIFGWQSFPTQSPICGGDDGLPTELDGITFSKWRAESIKGYGNAIVPQIAYQLFEIINDL